MKNSKGKGSAAERKIARFFTRWLTGQDKELYFWRSPSSGQLCTINVGNKSISGDLMALKPEASFLTDIFNIEIKDGYGNTDLFQHLKGIKNFNIESFWKQCTRDAYENDKLPLLIFNKKNGIYTASLDNNGYELVSEKTFTLSSICMMWNNESLPNLYMFNMEELFNSIRPGDLKK